MNYTEKQIEEWKHKANKWEALSELVKRVQSKENVDEWYGKYRGDHETVQMYAEVGELSLNAMELI